MYAVSDTLNTITDTISVICNASVSLPNNNSYHTLSNILIVSYSLSGHWSIN